MSTGTEHTQEEHHVEAWRDGNGWAKYEIEGVAETDTEMEANRKLFQAAPEMLASLKEILPCFTEQYHDAWDACNVEPGYGMMLHSRIVNAIKNATDQ